MNAQVIWTFEWTGGQLVFVAPEPCTAFTAGEKGDLPLPRCKGTVRFAMGRDAVSAFPCPAGRIDGRPEGEVRVEPGKMIDVTDPDGNPSFRFGIQLQEQPDAPTFDRSIELALDRVCFGASEDCHVQFPMIGPKGKAFELIRSGSEVQVAAEHVLLGVYVNNRRLEPGLRRTLRDGDFIFTSNATFAWLGGRLLASHTARVYDLPYADSAEQNSHLVYPKINRTTRFHEVVPTEPLEIQDPPRLPEPQQRNVLISLMPAVGMLLLTLLVRGRMSGGGMALFSVFSMGIGAVASVLTYFETGKKYRTEKQERERLYRAYIDQRRQEIVRQRERERDILRRIYLSPEQELRNVEEFTADLFDRSREDSDFLDICLGTGTVASCQPIRCKSHEVFEKTDDLFDLPHQLSAALRYVRDMPVVVKGAKANAIGVQGNVESLGLMMNQITLDLATRHYPSDLALYQLCGVEFEPQMYASRMLPHIQNPNLGRRNIVHDSESRELILEKLFKEFTLREENRDYAAAAQWMVIFVYTDADLMQHPLMRYIPQASSLHALFIFFAQHREQLPIGCSCMVRLFNNARSGLLVNMFDRESDLMFAYRGVDCPELENSAQKLAPVYSGETSLSSELARSLSFYDMPGIDRKVAAEDILARWRSADTRVSLAAPLGIALGGKSVALDLVETAHGPHGLVAGTTGSGKSELLISYILSLACCFSPEDVNFVIIDFKGGGTATQFAGLPHLIGTITNLSDSEMQRSLVSIRAEHRRRQQLFNEAGVSNINSYTTEYRAGRAKQPLPHLIIIADEFAELKAQQPEFMDELISTSRIGRSLGIHLILATQKPAGVVNEQIWSNSDFKLCLRVQTREDSNEVLRSPLASEIREPGRAYFQVGRAGIFQLFQSGYSGVPAAPETGAGKRFRIDRRSLSGRRTLLYEHKPQRSDSDARVLTQFDEALSEIVRANALSGCATPRMLCMPPLPENLPFDEAPAAGSPYELPIGLYDQPSQQRQAVLTYNPLAGNLLVVGAAQMGKTTLLQTLVRAAAQRMDARDVAFYILDFNTGVFKALEKLSVIGGVVSQDQEERFKNLIKLLRQEIAGRKSVLAESSVTSFRAYKEEGGSLPVIIVMLDNYAAYRELYDEDYGSDITYLFREGPSVGVSFCVTATRGILLGARNMSSFSQRILLHISDMNNMNEVIEGFRRKIPEQPGRGLSVIDKELLEVQLYNAFGSEPGGERAAMERFVQAHSGGAAARSIPEVPSLLTRARLEEMFGAPSNPFEYAYGMEYASVEPAVISLAAQFELVLVGRNEGGKQLFLRALLERLGRPELAGRVKVHIVDHYDRPLEAWQGAPFVAEYTTDLADAKQMVSAAHAMAKERIGAVREQGAQALQGMALHVIIINTREAVNAISGDSACVKAYEEMRDQYKLMKLLFIFGNLDNKAVTFSAPALLRQLKEGRQALQFEPLATGRMYEIDGLTVRENRVNLTRDDAFRLDDGAISHVKLVTPEG